MTNVDLPVAVMRRSPADFVVDELPLYPPSGKGEHLFVTFRKTGRNTADAVRAIAMALEVDPRGAGFAGMKDRHAITTQTASFPFPMARNAEEAVAKIDAPGIELIASARHDNKLKPGHLAGNRFAITLRDLDESGARRIAAALTEMGSIGVPNAFGPQRFGRDGDNPDRALAWLRGQTRGPRDRREQRFLVSALQSLLYNRVLARREVEGTWRRVLPGDVAKKTDTGGLFTVPLEGADADDAALRGEAGALTPTGPMFGGKMRPAEGAPGAIERQVLAEALGEATELTAFRNLGDGTRRSFVLPVRELEIDLAPPFVALTVKFVLPKGGYATTVLGRACVLKEEHGAAVAEEAPSADDA